MQHFVLHSMARLAVGVVIGCGVLVSNGVRADTVFKDTEVRADAKPEAKPGIFSSMVGATSDVVSRTGDVVMNALGMIGLRYRFAAIRLNRASTAAALSATSSTTPSASCCRVARWR